MLSFTANCENDSTVYILFDEVLIDGDVNFLRGECANTINWDGVSRTTICQECGEEILLCCLCDMDECDCSNCPYRNEMQNMNILNEFLKGNVAIWIDGDRTELNDLLDSHNVKWMSGDIFSEFDCNECYISIDSYDNRCTFSNYRSCYRDKLIVSVEEFLTDGKGGEYRVNKFEVGDLVKYNGRIGVVLIIDSMVGVGFLGDFDGHDLGRRVPKQFKGKCYWCEKRFLVKLPNNKVV